MKYSCWLLPALLFFYFQCEAQNEGSLQKGGLVYGWVIYERTMNYKTSVNISPLALLSLDNQLMVGMEQRLEKDWAFVADVGFIFHSSYLSEVKAARGFEIRPGIRYYHGAYKTGYWQTQLFYKWVDYQLHDWLGKDAVNRVATYEQLQDFNYRKRVLSLSFIAGEAIPLSKSIFVELYGGIGIRYKDQGITERNAFYGPGEESTRIIYGPHVWSICAPAGVKLSFIVR